MAAESGENDEERKQKPMPEGSQRRPMPPHIPELPNSADPYAVLPPELPANYLRPPPVPVSALPYSTPGQSGKPGILTAVSIISIVLASLGILSGLGTGCQSLMFMSMGRTIRRGMSSGTITSGTARVPVSPGGPQTIAPPALVVSDDGLDAADRAVVISTLNSMVGLGEAHKKQLEEFLAEHGQDVFPTAGRKLSDAQVRAIVTRYGQNASGTTVSYHFTTSRGTFTVYDDKVVFLRPNGGDPVVTTAQDSSLSTQPTGSTPGYRALTSIEAQAVTVTVSTTAKHAFNHFQTNTLETELQNPQQDLVPTANIASPIINATATSAGGMFIQFSGGATLLIDTSGNVTQRMSPSSFMFGGGTGKFSPVPFLASAAESVLAIGLAILLMVAGIQTVRQAPSGRRLHLIWAWVKIPEAILGWAAWGWMYSEWMSGMIGAFPARSASIVGFWIAAAGLALVSLIYPISLLIVFRTRQVRDYYNVAQV